MVANSIKKVRRYDGQAMQPSQGEGDYEAGGAPQWGAAAAQQRQAWGAGGDSGAAQWQQQGQEQGGQRTSEEMWMDLFQNPHQWTDFRAQKADGTRSEKHPDFKKRDGSAFCAAGVLLPERGGVGSWAVCLG